MASKVHTSCAHEQRYGSSVWVNGWFLPCPKLFEEKFTKLQRAVSNLMQENLESFDYALEFDQLGNPPKLTNWHERCSNSVAEVYHEQCEANMLRNVDGNGRSDSVDQSNGPEFAPDELAMDIGDLYRLIDEGVDFNLIDVRSTTDFRQAHLPNAIHLPESEWPSFRGLARDRLNVLYGQSPADALPLRAARFFTLAGFDAMYFEPGLEAWEDYGYDIIRTH